MPVSVTLPALGESVTEGTVTRWLKKEGDSVVVDEPLLEISTDKVDTEIPAPASGTLLKITVGEDETVEVGAELAVIGEAGEAPGGAPAAAPALATPAPASAPVETPAPAAPTADSATADAPAPQGPPPAPSAPAGAGVPVTLPALGESVTEGTVTRWLKAEGDSVAVDEPLLEISTDKVDTEIPSPAAGILAKILVAADQTVDVGTELGIIGAAAQAPAPAAPPASPAPPAPPAAEAPPAPSTPPAPPAPPAAPAPVTSTTPPPPAALTGNGQDSGVDVSSYVTPLVRKLASDNGIDLSRISGTGVGGRIRKQDVLDAARAQQDAQKTRASVPSNPSPAAAPAASAQPPALSGTEPMSRLRRVIAARMLESLHTSAQLTTVVEVDLTRVVRLRELAKNGFEAREGVKLSFLPFFAKATVEALKTHPKLNASLDAEKSEITYHGGAHLGIAVDTERGLLVPVIKNAGDLNIGGLTRKIADLATRTRNSKIGPDELGGGTFTLTNTGSRGALFDTPIINQPQVAILGLGAIVKRAVVIDHPELGETIAVRSMVYLALTYDHRLVDGADAARFLVTVKARLEEGAFEAELGL